jgi:GNAT superfamily N-acetyltransferase
MSGHTVPIRTATENDLTTINDVWLDADGVDDRPSGVLPLHAHELRTGTLLVAESDGDIVGFGAVVERDGLTILADLFVRRRVQAQGIGRALLDALFTAHPGPVRATMASADPRAQALYRAFGMRERFTNHYLITDGRWSAPSPLTVSPVAIGDELAGLDTRFYGRQRRVDLDYWAGLGAVAATFAPHGRGPVGYALVCPHTPWHPDGDATRLGPIVARDRYWAVDVVRSALAFADALPGRAPAMRLTIGSRHPAMATLVAAGFTAYDVDVFMSSRPDVVDPTRVALTADLL